MLEVILETKELSHVLGFASSIVEKRNVIAELNNVKLLATDTSLEIIATDMNLYFCYNIGARIINGGCTTVSTIVFTDIIKKINDSEIKIRLSDNTNHLDIIGKNCFFQLPTLSDANFPVINIENAKAALKITCRDLVHIIECTHFAISLEETRYNLNGVYLHVCDSLIKAAATDGHRLSVAAVIPQEHHFYLKEFGIILPRKTVQEVLKIAKDPRYLSADIDILLTTNKIKFCCNNITIISKLIDGQFPKYESFIPSTHKYKLTINTQLLFDVIDRVSTITVDKRRAVKFNINQKLFEIKASGDHKGLAVENISFSKQEEDFCIFEGDDEVSISFNPKYISDVLHVIQSKTIELYLINNEAPAVIKIPNNLLDCFVIMPVRA